MALHTVVSTSLCLYEYSNVAIDLELMEGRHIVGGCIGNGPLESCTKPDNNTTNLEHVYTPKTNRIHFYIRSLCPPTLSVSFHSEFTFTSATPPANHKLHST